MGVDACMFVLLPAPITDDERLRIAWECANVSDIVYGVPCIHFGRGALDSYHERDSDVPAVRTRLHVSLGCRYYGDGYERGPVLAIAALAAWLEARTGGRVMYHGDSTDEHNAEALDADARDAMVRMVARRPPYHIMGYGSAAYHGPYCKACQQPMQARLSGGRDNVRGYVCDVCGEHATLIGPREVRTFNDYAPGYGSQHVRIDYAARGVNGELHCDMRTCLDTAAALVRAGLGTDWLRLSYGPKNDPHALGWWLR